MDTAKLTAAIDGLVELIKNFTAILKNFIAGFKKEITFEFTTSAE